MSKVEVDKIDPQSGTALEIGSSGDTITFPSGTTVINNGTGTGFAPIAWQSVVTASTLTAVAGRGYWINTDANACTITLPGSASAGDQIIFTDYTRNWGTNAVTINPNSLKFQGNTTPQPVYDTDGESVNIVYSGATQGWIPNNDGEVALETPQTYSVDFLVVAGGGGGGQDDGGGGGAGGYRTSTQASQSAGNTITVTVGDGGANRTSGSNSSVSGTGITTITSAGGGRGGDGAVDNAAAGGSGGGGGNTGSEPGAAGNTPSTDPVQGYAGAAGQNPAPRNSGGGGGAASYGGDGVSNSITGSGVFYAGGGGGATRVDGTPRPGGDGGGGNGGTDSPANASTAGTVNTGGGGGGGSGATPQEGSAGGKGVVIVSMPDANYSGSTTGSPTVATGVSGKTVLTFTGSGSYVS